MRVHKFLAALFLSAVVAPLTSVAETPAGLFRANLDSMLFGFGSGEFEHDNDNVEHDFDAATVGLGLDSAGVGLGYTVIDGLLIGGRISLGLRGFDDYLDDSDAFFWSVLPYGEYIFLDGVARPFVTAVLGFEGKNFDQDAGDRWWWGFEIGAGGGGHFFVLDQLSLDATMLFSFIVGTGEDESAANNTVDFNHWRFRLSALVGLSAWF